MNASMVIWAMVPICFLTFFVINLVYIRLGVNNLETALFVTNGLRILNLKHLLGIILFGIIFYIIFPEFRFLVEIIEIPRLNLLLPFILILLLVAYLSRMSFKKNIMGSTGIHKYTTVAVWFFFLLRFSFLLATEFFFRGIIVFQFLEFGSPLIAIISSTALFGLLHVFVSKKEFSNAILLGILLALFSYLTESIWYAFMIHLTLVAVYEISMFYDFSFNKSTYDQY